MAPALEPPRLPDALLLEVVTAPGYDWMKACLQAGGLAGAGLDSGSPADSSAASSAHAAHHPRPAAVAASLLGSAGLEETLAALKAILDALESPRPASGQTPADAAADSDIDPTGGIP